MKKKYIPLLLISLTIGLIGCSSKESVETMTVIDEPVEIESSEIDESTDVEETTEIESSVIEESSEIESETQSEVESSIEETTEVEEITDVIETKESEETIIQSGVSQVQSTEEITQEIDNQVQIEVVDIQPSIDTTEQISDSVQPQPETQPQQSTTSNGVTYNADGSITFYNSDKGYTATARMWNEALGIYRDQEGIAYNSNGQQVDPFTGELWVEPEIDYGNMGCGLSSGSGLSRN